MLFNFAEIQSIPFSPLFDIHFNDQDAEKVGYMHLMHSKTDPTGPLRQKMWENIRKHTETTYPEYYKRAKRWLANDNLA